jgi:hypothetical protein
MKAIKENRKANPTDTDENDGTQTDPYLLNPVPAEPALRPTLLRPPP